VKTFSIEPVGPFSLAAAQSFAGGFSAGIGGGDASGPGLVMAFPVEGAWHESAGVDIHQGPDGIVHGRVFGSDDVAGVQRQAARSLSLDHDGRGWPGVGERDPVIGRLQAAHDFLRPVCFYSAYEAATSFVIGQRIAMIQSARIKAWLRDELGDRVALGDGVVDAFPRPERLLELRSAPGLNAEKIVRLHGLAEAALDGRLDTMRLRTLAPADALAELASLRGVGPWTAEAILLRGCGPADELPANDEISREAVRDLYGLAHPPDEDRWRTITDGWRPYRMWATVLLRVGWNRMQPKRPSYRRDRA
jgi:DNA-3-methyladenine glycosylase II